MIENADGTPEEKEKKKRETIELNNLKRNSTIFIMIGSLVQIVESLLVLAVLLFLMLIIMFKVLNLQMTDTVYIAMEVGFMVLFLVGLLLGFFLYRKTMDWAIKKFNLKDKIPESTLAHYKIETKAEKQARLRR